MARVGKRRNDDFCSAHAGEIASFAGLVRRIPDPSEYDILYQSEVLNYRRLCRIAAVSVSGAVAIAPIAFLAAPSIGAVVSTTITRIAGRSAVAQGLTRMGVAMLEAGETAAAANVAVMTTLGAATGGILSGVIANAYFGDVEGFAIRRFHDGIDPGIMVINGFLTQDRRRPEDVWRPMLERHYPDNAWYIVEWESKRLKDLGRLTVASGGNEVVRAALVRSLRRAAVRSGRSRIHPLHTLFTIMGLATNSWHVAMVKSAQTGVILADVLARIDPPRPFTLIGHSLGARVIIHALKALGENASRIVRDVHLVGAAAGAGPDEDYRRICDSIGGTLHNYHSSRDLVLQVLYSAGQFFLGSPSAGCRPIESACANLLHHDVSDFVLRHGDFKRKAADFWVR